MMKPKTVVILCSKCNLYQAAFTVYFGREIKNKKCVRCGNMIPLEGSTEVEDHQIPEYIRKLNYPKELTSVDEFLELE